MRNVVDRGNGGCAFELQGVSQAISGVSSRFPGAPNRDEEETLFT